jgi:hypothetical protein
MQRSRSALTLLGVILGGCSLTSLDGFSSNGSPRTGEGASVPGLDGGLVDGRGGGSSGGGPGPVVDGAPSSSIAFVQGQDRDLGGSGSGSISLREPVGAGNAVVIAVEYDSMATVTVSDGSATSYTPIVGPADALGSRGVLLAGFDLPGGARTFSVSLSGPSGTFLLVYLHEYRGLGAFDVGSWAQGTTKAADGMATSLAVGGANELLFAFGFSSYSVGVGSGFTERADLYMNLTEDRIIPSPGTTQATATMTSGNAWKILAAAFKGR